VEQYVCVTVRVVLVKVTVGCTFIYGFVGTKTCHTLLFNSSLPLFKLCMDFLTVIYVIFCEFYIIMLFCVLYCIVLYCTVMYCTVL
jgi:hypothetical protein